ncbi:MAG: hypothetical protein ACPLW5_02705 [Candidatus Bathyarchaeales archaeon]
MVEILPVTDENRKFSEVFPPRHYGYIVTIRDMLRVDIWHAPVVNSPTEKTYAGIFGLERFHRIFN